MKLKTVSVDLAAFRLLRNAKRPRESYGDVVRRVFAERAPADDLDAYLADLMANPIKADFAALRRRQKNPPRSRRTSVRNAV